jgi:hypothetical protein
MGGRNSDVTFGRVVRFNLPAGEYYFSIWNAPKSETGFRLPSPFREIVLPTYVLSFLIPLQCQYGFTRAPRDHLRIHRRQRYFSSLLAIGSIVMGLHHVWRHRVKLIKVDTSALQAVGFFPIFTRCANENFVSSRHISETQPQPQNLRLFP